MATAKKTTAKAAAAKAAAKKTTAKKTTAKKTPTKKSVVKAVTHNPKTFDYEKVEYLAGLGLTQDKIALALGCCVRTIRNHALKNAEFAEALARGMAKREVMVASKLAERCDDGDVSAIKFYLQAVAGWREKQEVQVKADVKAEVTISEKDMTTEQLQAAIAKLQGT